MWKQWKRAYRADEARRTMSDEPRETFDAAVEEGDRRLSRTWPGLLATGAVGGADVAAGVFAMLVVLNETHNALLGALAFSIGFVALTLANSELFTEDFLVPLAAVVKKKHPPSAVLRLWSGALVTNLAGGWLVMGMVMAGFPRLHGTARAVADYYPHIGIGWRSFAGALLGGAVITLMTWMERGTDSIPGKLVAAIAAAFLLAAAPLNHVIVVSLEMFGALQAGAHFGYLDWLSVAAWYALGNIVGGVGLVTMLRFIQVGRSPEGAE